MASAKQYASAYETTQKVYDTPPLGFNKTYLKTIPAIIKIVELICGFVAVLCAGIDNYAGRWFVQFVPGLGLVFTAILFLFYLTNLIYKLGFSERSPLVLFIGHCVVTILYVICFVVAAFRGVEGAGVVVTAGISLAMFVLALLWTFRLREVAVFVSLTSFLTTFTWFVFHLLGVTVMIAHRIYHWKVLELAYHVVFTVLWFVAAFVSAIASFSGGDNVIYCIVVAFFASSIYGVDTVFLFRTCQYAKRLQDEDVAVETDTVDINMSASVLSCPLPQRPGCSATKTASSRSLNAEITV